MTISAQRLSAGRLHNLLQTMAILAMMGLLFGSLGWLVFGRSGLLTALVFGGVILASSARLSPRMVLRMYGARRLGPADTPELHALVSTLARRAGLARVPRLYYVASSVLNAFSVGSKDDAAIAMTDGLLRHLDRRELAGVLAHEMGHVAANDLRLHALADMMTRITATLSFLGQILVVLYLPLALLGKVQLPLLPILLLIFAPTLSSLLQLALSRTREFAADLNAVRLSGDPLGLAAALQKLEHYDRSLWETLFRPGRRQAAPSMLRTHPHTAERVRRLLELARPADEPELPSHPGDFLPGGLSRIGPDPRRFRFRPWY